MEHLREMKYKSHKCVRLELIFHKKVHEGVFQNLLLNCTMNRDVCRGVEGLVQNLNPGYYL